MKALFLASLLLLPPAAFAADDADPPADEGGKPAAAAEATHREGATQIAGRQDELSADVEQLAIEQTVPNVIQLLNQVEAIMDEATDHLTEYDTGGRTIAAQTEVIEKIHEAAKEKQKENGSSQSGSAMMDMLERMMGKDPDGDKTGKSKDGKPADTGGNGMSGDSEAANTPDNGATGGKSEARRVPKASGGAGHAVPEEFQKALDAYNRGAEQKVK